MNEQKWLEAFIEFTEDLYYPGFYEHVLQSNHQLLEYEYNAFLANYFH